MRTRRRAGLQSVLLIVAAGVFAPRAARACTTFCLRGSEGLLFGKNYDFGIGGGMVVVNKRGVAKTARVAAPERAARWTSRYGSVTFNQYGREMPSGGMNEAGLVVELMWLDAARYPARDRRPALGALEWIQYQLDNFETVQELIAGSGAVRIASTTPLHYLVADAAGHCAAIEFLDGKLVARSGAAMPARVLTNDTYARSLERLRMHRGLGGDREAPPGSGSLDRFTRTATFVRGLEGRTSPPGVEDAFGVLESAATPGYTQWSIVYDVRERRVHFRTRDVPSRRSVDLASLDFTCGTPVRVLDLSAPLTGDVSLGLVPYSREINRALVVSSFRGVDFLRETPPAELEAIARHPETTACAVPGAAR